MPIVAQAAGDGRQEFRAAVDSRSRHPALVVADSLRIQEQAVKRIIGRRVGVLQYHGQGAGRDVGEDGCPSHQVSGALQYICTVRDRRELEGKTVRDGLNAQLRRNDLRYDKCRKIRDAGDEDNIVRRIEGEWLRNPVCTVPFIDAQIAAVARIIGADAQADVRLQSKGAWV